MRRSLKMESENSEDTVMYICHCGFPRNNHYFKHAYTRVTKVARKRKEVTINLRERAPITEDEKARGFSIPDDPIEPQEKTIVREIYGISASKFPLKIEITCSVPDCLATKDMHSVITYENKQLIKHDFSPCEKTYKEIKFTLPDDANCNVCGVNILSHYNKENAQTLFDHHFTTKVRVKNISKNDKLILRHPEDEDIIIINEQQQVPNP